MIRSAVWSPAVFITAFPFFIALTLDPGNFDVTNSNQIVTLQLTFRTTFRRSIAHVQSAGKHEKSTRRLNGAGMLEAGIFSMNLSGSRIDLSMTIPRNTLTLDNK